MDPLLIDIPDEIVTARLRLRAPRDGEAAEMNRAIRESIDELNPWMPWANPMPAMEQTQVYCQRSIARQAVREEISYRLYLRDADLYAGHISLTRMNWNVPRFEIGFWIRTSLSRRGYVTEAVGALTEFAFSALKACRVEIHSDEKNIGSRRVAEKAGFTLEGILRNQQRDSTGRLENMCVYARIASPAD
jgi:ribosomal-protein-serine acetyltransferase